jgi:hypothetical protein
LSIEAFPRENHLILHNVRTTIGAGVLVMNIRTRLLITVIILILFALLARAAQHAEAETFGAARWLIPWAAVVWLHKADTVADMC